MLFMINLRERTITIPYQDMINSQGKIKHWQTICKEGKSMQQLAYFQLTSRLREMCGGRDGLGDLTDFEKIIQKKDHLLGYFYKHFNMTQKWNK